MSIFSRIISWVEDLFSEPEEVTPDVMPDVTPDWTGPITRDSPGMEDLSRDTQDDIIERQFWVNFYGEHEEGPLSIDRENWVAGSLTGSHQEGWINLSVTDESGNTVDQTYDFRDFRIEDFFEWLGDYLDNIDFETDIQSGTEE